jgi:hypothetical protein
MRLTNSDLGEGKSQKALREFLQSRATVGQISSHCKKRPAVGPKLNRRKRNDAGRICVSKCTSIGAVRYRSKNFFPWEVVAEEGAWKFARILCRSADDMSKKFQSLYSSALRAHTTPGRRRSKNGNVHELKNSQHREVWNKFAEAKRRGFVGGIFAV